VQGDHEGEGVNVPLLERTWRHPEHSRPGGTGGQAAKEYLVIFEWVGRNYSAYVPDLPGCASTGKTLDDAERNIREAISLYIDTLRADGRPIPAPTTKARPVTVAA